MGDTGTPRYANGHNGGQQPSQAHPWRRPWRREVRLKTLEADLRAAHARVRKAKGKA